MNSWCDKEEFKTRVLEWAAKLDVNVRGLFVRPMRNKWASCSTAGTLSFNDELLRMERDLGDYVIVHELLHFSVPNHGKLWKTLMRAHLGEYEHLEAKMKQAAHNKSLQRMADSRRTRTSPISSKKNQHRKDRRGPLQDAVMGRRIRRIPKL
jgi:predicted metal-dependent hydrolase